MAITRAQQAKQMLQDGGMLVKPGFGGTRQGYRGDAAARSTDAAKSGRADPGSRGDPRDGPKTMGRNPMAQFTPQAEAIAKEMRDATMGAGDRFVPDIFPITKGLANIFQVKKPTPFDIQRRGFIKALGPQTVDFSGMDRGGDVPYWAQLGFSSEAEYLAALARTQAPSITEQETTADDDTDNDGLKLRFRAEGGRVEAQEGGIMPRLNQLGSGVSSAEQTLQEINQRLESAESSLGSGGGMQQPFMGRPDFEAVVDPSAKTQQLQQADPNNSLLGIFPSSRPENTMGPIAQIPATGGLGIPAAGYADGGNVVGGEFDFESARQMYGLGKLVKKVTRTVKKIAKSPIGKVAIAGAALKFGGGFLKGKGIMSSLFGSPALAGSGRDFFMGMGGKSAATKGLLGKLGLTAGGGSLMPTALGGIAAASALAGLLTPEQEEEAQALSRGEGIDIEAARRSILNAGTAQDFRARRFRAEGGSMKEPVAKKTMPLLDMGGQEMDLRAKGGFVPIGRMEKADDVPARLSKNEFVFTADAVRNAGDGDVDKGAEVMYNMMKNLEAGGDVSEESQGLEGARKMFQTSQRLEEVL